MAAKLRHHLVDACHEQVAAFYEGLADVAERSALDHGPWLLRVTHSDLDALLGGQVGAPQVADWRASTRARGFAADCPLQGWFWAAVEAMAPGQRQRLLRFWTGAREFRVGQALQHKPRCGWQLLPLAC